MTFFIRKRSSLRSEVLPYVVSKQFVKKTPSKNDRSVDVEHSDSAAKGTCSWGQHLLLKVLSPMSMN